MFRSSVFAYIYIYAVVAAPTAVLNQPVSQLLRTGDRDMLLASVLPKTLVEREGRNSADVDTADMCDDVQVEVIPDGEVVNILMKPFGLVCVVVDLLTGGSLAAYLENGKLNLHIDDGYGLLNGLKTPLERPQVSLSVLKTTLSPSTSSPLSPFATAYLHSLLMTTYTSDSNKIKSEIQKRLDALPATPSEAQVMSVLLNSDQVLMHTHISDAVNTRLKSFPLIYAQTLIDTPIKSPEEIVNYALPSDFNMRDIHGRYQRPKAFYVFPDKQQRYHNSFDRRGVEEMAESSDTLTHTPFSQIVNKIRIPQSVTDRAGALIGFT